MAITIYFLWSIGLKYCWLVLFHFLHNLTFSRTLASSTCPSSTILTFGSISLLLLMSCSRQIRLLFSSFINVWHLQSTWAESICALLILICILLEIMVGHCIWMRHHILVESRWFLFDALILESIQVQFYVIHILNWRLSLFALVNLYLVGLVRSYLLQVVDIYGSLSSNQLSNRWYQQLVANKT